jgi:hypothetical protein
LEVIRTRNHGRCTVLATVLAHLSVGSQRNFFARREPSRFQTTPASQRRVARTRPGRDLPQTFPRTASKPCDRLSTWDLATSVIIDRLLPFPALQWASVWSLVGIDSHFLARGGVPHRRRQAVAKCFGLDAPLRSAWRVEDAALHRGRVVIDGSPHRCLCVRCWKPRFSWRCGALNYEMAISD